MHLMMILEIGYVTPNGLIDDLVVAWKPHGIQVGEQLGVRRLHGNQLLLHVGISTVKRTRCSNHQPVEERLAREVEEPREPAFASLQKMQKAYIDEHRTVPHHPGQVRNHRGDLWKRDVGLAQSLLQTTLDRPDRTFARCDCPRFCILLDDGGPPFLLL
jgi:hypothetical protein